MLKAGTKVVLTCGDEYVDTAEVLRDFDPAALKEDAENYMGSMWAYLLERGYVKSRHV